MISESEQQAAVNGDVEIQDEIILKLSRHVCSYVRYHAPRIHHDEILSIGLLELVKRLRNLSSPRPNLKAYILVAVKHRMIDYLRKEKIRQTEELHEVAINTETPESLARDYELQPDQIELIKLRLEGYTYREIANILGITLANVHRNILKIREAIK